MKIAKISCLNFKNSPTQPQNTSVNGEVSQAQKIRHHLEMSGLTSKPVKIGAIVGFLMGASYSIGKQLSLAKGLVNAMCMSAIGIFAGKIANRYIKTNEAE